MDQVGKRISGPGSPVSFDGACSAVNQEESGGVGLFCEPGKVDARVVVGHDAGLVVNVVGEFVEGLWWKVKLLYEVADFFVRAPDVFPNTKVLTTRW